MSTMTYEKSQGYGYPDMGALGSEYHERSLAFTKKPGQDRDQVLRVLSYLGLTSVEETSASLSKKEGNLFRTMVNCLEERKDWGKLDS